MKHIRLILVLALAFILTACASQDAGTTDTTATPKATATATATPDGEPTDTAEAAVSYTTGLPFDGEYKPVMVVIENSPAARPQTGLQTADVVYEVPVEGGISRFVCVFSDNVPDEVMPVRSGRVPFLYIQNEWDAVFMHFGGAGENDLSAEYSFYGHALYSELKFDIDGLTGWNDYYYRASGIKAPHNVVGNPLLAQDLYDYDPAPLTWLFDSASTYTGEDGTEINLNMCTGDSDFVSYTYDAENDVYLRSMNGKAFTSAETGEQVSVKNVIVQYSTYVALSEYKLWEMTGSGDADIYIGGVLIHGTWERASSDDETVYYDDQGQEIVLRPGNTWIHLDTKD